jgi:hypothetical protein
MSYTTGPRSSNPRVCDPPKASYSDTELMTMYSGGVASDSLVPDPASGRVSVALLSTHVNALTAAGVLTKRPTVSVGVEKETDMRSLVDNDAQIYAKLQEEYCYYEQRYKYAFKKFLTLSTSRIAADNRAAEVMLRNTKLINIRVNGVLEVMNYLAGERVGITNLNKTDINKRNEDINTKLDRLRNSYKILDRDNAVILAQKEMVRYTEEKNNYTSNQIGIWAAANLVALGVIFYVYRN